MCGFAGILKNTANHSLEDERILKRMVSVMKNRGPDANSSHWEGPCGLGHARLSIIDLSENGRQPMTNEDGTVWITFSGVIYNFRDLRRQFALELNGHVFRSRTDTEVLIHLYEEIGSDMLRYLDGMFAFALWDAKRRRLILARDGYGVKPLFYCETSRGLVFGSEIKSILEVPEYIKRPSLESLHHFLSFNYIPGEHTAFSGIHELRPGHSIIVDFEKASRKVSRFFEPICRIDTNMSESEAVSQTRALLTAAVERQLVSDVPVGVMLSGGMDSSVLTQLMATVRGNADFHTFSIGFDDESFDESRYARVVAKSVGTNHHEIKITPERVLDQLPGYLASIDEPYGDGSAIPTFYLAKVASEYVSVLLSGEGGDEFFAGYDTHAAYVMRKYYRRIPSFVRQNIIQRIVRLLPVSHKKLSFEFKAKKFVRGAELSVPRAHHFWREVLSEEQKKDIVLDQSLYSKFPDSSAFFESVFYGHDTDEELNRILCLDYRFHLPDDLMVKNDRMTMANSIEARVPYTDNELVSFLATVPVRWKLKGLKKKNLLRSAFSGELPRSIINKKKVGLEMPYSSWMLNDLRELSESVFSKESIERTGLFNVDGVRAVWDDHINRKSDNGRPLWGLMNYIMWHEMYIQRGDYLSYLPQPRAAREVVV